MIGGQCKSSNELPLVAASSHDPASNDRVCGVGYGVIEVRAEQQKIFERADVPLEPSGKARIALVQWHVAARFLSVRESEALAAFESAIPEEGKIALSQGLEERKILLAHS
jgi:hypothetical protein